MSELLILLLSLRAYYPSARQRRAGREGNTIARLFLDEPGMLESMLFYVVLTHVMMASLLFLAHLSARAKQRRARSRDPAGPVGDTGAD